MIGLVERTYRPGSKHDEAPVLIGAQGGGKSTFCEQLLPPEYLGWHRTLDNIQAEVQKRVERIDAAAIVEFAELRVLGGYGEVKNFLSDRADSYRLPYARQSQTVKRRWVGIATANDEGEGVLPDDPTGNRRYVAVKVNPPGSTSEEQSAHVREYLGEHRTQLWAEAKARYERGEKSFLAGGFEREREDVNKAYTRANQPLEQIAADLTSKHAAGPPVTLVDLMMESALARGRRRCAGEDAILGPQTGGLPHAALLGEGAVDGRWRPKDTLDSAAPRLVTGGGGRPRGGKLHPSDSRGRQRLYGGIRGPGGGPRRHARTRLRCVEGVGAPRRGRTRAQRLRGVQGPPRRAQRAPGRTGPPAGRAPQGQAVPPMSSSNYGDEEARTMTELQDAEEARTALATAHWAANKAMQARYRAMRDNESPDDLTDEDAEEIAKSFGAFLEICTGIKRLAERGVALLDGVADARQWCACGRPPSRPARKSGGPVEETGFFDCYECREDALEEAWQGGDVEETEMVAYIPLDGSPLTDVEVEALEEVGKNRDLREGERPA